MADHISKVSCELINIQIAGMSCTLFLPESYAAGTERYPVIYINGEIEIGEVLTEVRKTGAITDFLLLSIEPEDWNNDFTPWSAPAFRKGETAPLGRARDYISRLSQEIKPYMDTNYRTKPEPEYSVLLGYSLGGLAAVYSLYQTDCFGYIGSLSGSLWYDDFCEFMEKNAPLRSDVKVYLSLGKKESLSRNPRMGRVAECTERAKDILGKWLAGDEEIENGESLSERGNVRLEWNEGGHFHEIPKRFARAILWWEKRR